MSRRIIGRDGNEIRTLTEWFEHAPPEKGESQWVDGYSAKEAAKAWLRRGAPEIPAEIEYALRAAGLSELDGWTAYPEHRTQLDDFGRGGQGKRQHDVLLEVGTPDRPLAVVGIEAKACEGYDGTVGKKAEKSPPSELPARCNLLSQALFGRPVWDADRRELVDRELALHGYQLWTAAVGTVREAQARGLEDAILLVHQFAPAPSGPALGDDRPWSECLAKNASMLFQFREALGVAVTYTYGTEFVGAGTRLSVLDVCSLVQTP